MTRTAVLALSLLFAGCGNDPLRCEDVAMSLESGAPDPADLTACRQCMAACEGDCKLAAGGDVNTYECRGETWDVYDVCADWPEACTPE